MRRLAPALVAVAALVVACGVPEDEVPQELSVDEVPEGLLTVPTTTTTPLGAIPPERVGQLYYVNADNQLVQVEREVPDQSARAVIGALLETDPESLDPGTSSFIPPGTTLLEDVSLDDDVLTVDLSEEFDTVTGTRFTLAVAQIVFTATEIPGGQVARVAFRVEGEAVNVNDDDGRSQSDPVSPNDYQELLAVRG